MMKIKNLGIVLCNAVLIANLATVPSALADDSTFIPTGPELLVLEEVEWDTDFEDVDAPKNLGEYQVEYIVDPAPVYKYEDDDITEGLPYNIYNNLYRVCKTAVNSILKAL